MKSMLKCLLFGLKILSIHAAAPVFNPVTYNIVVGLNTTAGAVLTTLTATDADNDALTYATASTGGAVYFAVDTSTGNANLVLANLLDVEYGGIQWNFKVFVSDSVNIATATVSVSTYLTTTSTTTTVAPPGYDWFSDTNNAILFGSVMAFTAILSGVCVLCCWKFHRDGTCLPESCPTYRQCWKSASRTCDLPIPCNYYETKKKKKKRKKARKKSEKLKKLSEPPKPQPKVVVEMEREKNSDTKTSKTPKTSKPAQKTTDKTGDNRNGSVTPISIGNVSLHDVGMDRARTPGFNAPAVTSYGGKRSISPKLFKKR